MGENAFMDMEYQEFKALMMKGRKRYPGFKMNAEKIVYLNITDMPETVDWRERALTPVSAY